MIIHLATTNDATPAEPIYQRDVWAVTPALDKRGRQLKTLFHVTHVPTGRKCHAIRALRSDGAINLCRALATEFPGFMSEARFKDGGTGSSELGTMGRWVWDLYQAELLRQDALRSARKARR